MLPDGVVDFGRDAFLLARGGPVWTGDAFEAALGRLGRSRRYGSLFVQGAGLPTLFGRRGASGFFHEIDVAFQAARWVGLFEAKTAAGGPSKADVMLFDGKSFDLYTDRLLACRSGPHLRLLASFVPMRDEVTVFSAHRGIIRIQPDLIPLPLILRLLTEAIADQLFTDWEMEEADRLFTSPAFPWRRSGVYAARTSQSDFVVSIAAMRRT